MVGEIVLKRGELGGRVLNCMEMTLIWIGDKGCILLVGSIYWSVGCLAPFWTPSPWTPSLATFAMMRLRFARTSLVIVTFSLNDDNFHSPVPLPSFI